MPSVAFLVALPSCIARVATGFGRFTDLKQTALRLRLRISDCGLRNLFRVAQGLLSEESQFFDSSGHKSEIRNPKFLSGLGLFLSANLIDHDREIRMFVE